jgi:hypothetical protein
LHRVHHFNQFHFLHPSKRFLQPVSPIAGTWRDWRLSRVAAFRFNACSTFDRTVVLPSGGLRPLILKFNEATAPFCLGSLGTSINTTE